MLTDDLLKPKLPEPSEPIAVEYDPEAKKYRILLDASAYTRSACDRNLFYVLIKGLASPNKDHKMEYGTAVHHALGHYYKHKRHTITTEEIKRLQGEALSKGLEHFLQPDIIVPEEDYRNISHLINCVGQYFGTYELDPIEAFVVSGVAMVEQRFAVPFYVDNYVEILLAGTIDLVAYYINQLIIIDHKSTAATSPTWFLREYELSSQLMMYVFVFSKLFPSLVDEYYSIGAMINGIFLRKSGTNDFRRSDVFHFRKEQLEMFEQHLKITAKHLAEAFREWLSSHGSKSFIQNFTQCYTHFGCPFVEICKAGDIEREELIRKFELRKYNPLTHQM